MAKGTFTRPVTGGLYSQRGGLDFSGKTEAVAVVGIALIFKGRDDPTIAFSGRDDSTVAFTGRDDPSIVFGGSG